MIKRFSFIFLCALFMATTSQAQQAIGQWAEKLSYRQTYEITSDGNLAFAASGDGLFSYEFNSGLMSRLTKVNGLSDVGIRSVAYDSDQDLLIIGYANGNLDLVRGAQIDNISDIKRSNIIGDLGINDITLVEEEAWLACGFGIVVIDVVDLEVKDTYIIGDQGGNLAVNGVLVEDDNVYAATENGIRVADRDDNLSDFANWEPFVDGLPFPDEPYGQILRFQDKLLTFSQGGDEAAFVFEGLLWSEISGSSGEEPQRISVNNDQALIVYAHHFALLDQELNVISDTYTYPFDSYLELNSGYLTEDQRILIADDRAGMVMVYEEETTSIFPEGPYSDIGWKADAINGEFWVVHGELQSNFNNVFSNNGFSGFDGSEWRLKAEAPGLEEVRDLVDIKIDPFDFNKVYMGSFNRGLVVYDTGQDEIEVQNILEGNSPLDSSLQNPSRIQSGSLAFDFNGNLWVTNSYTTEGWKVLKTDGSWESIGCPTELSPNTLYGDMVINEVGQTWTILPRGNGLVVLQHENEVVSTSGYPCKKLTTEVGEGGLPTTTTLSIAEDLDGEIWLGTSEGPVVNYSPQSIFTNNATDFQPILVERDGNVERLLGSESITALEVDGANRKWLGTLNGGVFLLSEDGSEEIHHFTEENSPLFSNVIRDISIDHTTGVVHFLTNSGMISYMSDATLGEEKNECFDVYPNPVRPDYYGPITIEGLKAESEVKITDIAGNIVFQTISNGGRAIWQGTDFSGDRVSTGVYFALVSDRDGESSCISKVLFVN